MIPDLSPDELAAADRELARQLADKDSALAKAKKLEQLAPLGFQDPDDGEAPDAIWHPLIGPINHSSVRLDNVLDLAFRAGEIRGQEGLRAQLRALLNVAPAGTVDD